MECESHYIYIIFIYIYIYICKFCKEKKEDVVVQDS